MAALSGLRDLPSDLREGSLSQVFARTPGKFIQPSMDCGVLLRTHLFKQHAHAENSKAAARMHVEYFAMQFARGHAIADAETQFRTNGNGFERIDITTTRAQFGNLPANARSVAKANFGIREEREPRICARCFIGTFSHGVSPGARTPQFV